MLVNCWGFNLKVSEVIRYYFTPKNKSKRPSKLIEIKVNDPKRIFERQSNHVFRFTQKVSNIGDADFLSPTNPSEWEYHSCHK